MDNHSFRAAAIIGYAQIQDAAKEAGLQIRIERNTRDARYGDPDEAYDFVLTCGDVELCRTNYASDVRNALVLWVKMKAMTNG